MLIADFLPLIAFGGAYYLYDFYVATAALMVSMLLVVIYKHLHYGHVEKIFQISCLLVWLFGSLTIMLQDNLFLQWKPTVISWLIASLLLGSEWVGERNLIARIAGSYITLPAQTWRKVNLGWSAGFFLKGALNLYFALYHEESIWVAFKLFGQFTLTVVYLAITFFFLRNYLFQAVSDPSQEAKSQS